MRLLNSELLAANLLIEYIGYEYFQKVVKLVKPQHIRCIIQINMDNSFVSDTLYLHIFDCLDEVHHQMKESDLISSMQEIGYAKELIKETYLMEKISEN